MFLPSPSKVGLAEVCQFPWSRFSPRWPERTTSIFAGFGSAVGKVGELHASGEAVDLDAIAVEHKLTPGQVAAFRLCAGHVIERLDELKADASVTDLRAEVPFAWHAVEDAGRECGARAPGGRATDERDGERSGTVDIVYRVGGRLVILDWKTGPRAREHRPRETPQLVMYGLAAARAHGDREVMLVLAHVDVDGVDLVADVLDLWELDAAALRFRALFSRLAADDIVPTPGPHCVDMYCPIVSVCPVTVAAMREIERAAEAPPLALSMPDQITSPEHAAQIRVRLKMVEEACKVTKALALEPYVRRNGPLPLGNGKVWGAVQNDGRETVDLAKPGALDVLTKHLGAFGVDAAVERSTSKTAIHQAAVATAPKGKAAALERALFEELRGIEAVRRGAPYESFEEWKPKTTETETKEAA